MTQSNYNMPDNVVISLQDVIVDYEMKETSIRANNRVSFDIKENSITALVGESGSGKTTIAAAIINCLVEPGIINGGHVLYRDRDKNIIDVGSLKHQEILKFRWEEVSMVFQGAQSALNPVITIANQFKETMLVHNKNYTNEEIYKRSVEMLEYVNLEADRVLKMYPHELSGGMKQRVMIAFSMLLDPKLIILDEPTTALDVITQDYIFDILKRINKELGIAMLLLTHDIGIVAKYADYMGVMYAGRIIEFGDIYTVFDKTYHPYTKGLIKATPSLHLPVSDLEPIEGSPPDLLDLPSGCVFHPRCPRRMKCCPKVVPKGFMVEEKHFVECHLYGEGDCDE